MVPSGEPADRARFNDEPVTECIYPINSDVQSLRAAQTSAEDNCAPLPSKTNKIQHRLENVSAGGTNHQITFQSKVMRDLIAQAELFAKSSATVMITGESGTGKELFSRLIHDQSRRSKERFVAVNCAAMPEMLVESEFFGHERGAFTGAVQRRIGHFQEADQGTILLDEISEIPASIQAKLLRVIEEQEVQRVGGNQCEKIDVRIVATSNRELQKATASGSFRLDLYHRLNVLRLEIPPLRERTQDIPALVEHFIKLFRGAAHPEDSSREVTSIKGNALDKLCQHSWPGNIRELRNIIHYACVVCQSNEINVHDLPDLIDNQPPDLEKMEGRMLADVERQMIFASLKKFGGSKTLAAAELGVTSRTISNKLRVYQEQGLKVA